MSNGNQDLDLSAGEVPSQDRKVTNEILKREQRRNAITYCLAWISIVLVLLFYGCLLCFLFWGGLRNEAWIWSVTDGARFALSDLPIIVVLSTVPTLILITMLRHYRVQNSERESVDTKDDAMSPLTVQLCREVVKAADLKG